MNILITGGASGLGESITKTLARAKSNKIYFTFSKSEANALEIEKEFPNAKGLQVDFTNKDELGKLILELENLELDVLVNNAMTGDIHKNYFHKTNSEIFLTGFQNNILPVIQLTQKAISLFRKKKFGKVITILSSAIVDKPPIGWSEYVAAKNYLLSLSKSWAVENAAFNISCNAISPSFMRTRLTADTDERIVEDMIQKSPSKKLLATQEVADSVLYFVNAEQEINGENKIMMA